MENAFATFERRLAAAEDRLEIIDLEAEYSRAWDSGDTDGWADVFTPDGVFEITKSGDQPTRLVTGTEELAGFCAEVSEYYQGLHFNTAPRLRVDGDMAWGHVSTSSGSASSGPGQGIAANATRLATIR
ncbi:nuclear transport factor 2 family protein [Sphingobium chungangianum]